MYLLVYYHDGYMFHESGTLEEINDDISRAQKEFDVDFEETPNWALFEIHNNEVFDSPRGVSMKAVYQLTTD